MARQPAEGSSRPKAPLRPSCESCRLRRIKCVRPLEVVPGQDTTCEACKRKDIACVFVERPKTRNRSGKNVEEARNRYGSLVPSQSTSPEDHSPSPELVAQRRIVQEEMAGAFGNRLFELWLDQNQLRENWPPLDLPVVDFWELRSRYRAAGNRLNNLDEPDQLLCRLVYAVAAPMYLPSHLSGNSRHDISTKLYRDAEQVADALAIWRKLDQTLRFTAALVMFHKILATRDMRDQEAPSYLAAAVQQLRTLARQNPQTVLGIEIAGTGRVAWCVAIVDALSAAERKTKPCLTRDELSEFLGRKEPILPNLQTLEETIKFSAEATTGQVLDALYVLITLAFDVANFASAPSASADQLPNFWRRLEEIYAWCHGSLSICSITIGEGTGVCAVYSGAIWAISIMFEFALVEHVTGLVTQVVTQSSTTFGTHDTDHLASFVGLRNFAQNRTLSSICSFLRVKRQLSKVATLGIIHRVGSSVSRVLDFAQAFSSAPVDDLNLFPGGPTDKCASIDYVLPQLSRLAEAYPSPRISTVLDALRSESASLRSTSDDGSHSIFDFLSTPGSRSSTETLPLFSPGPSTFADPSPNLVNVEEPEWDWQDLLELDTVPTTAWNELSNAFGQQ